MKLTKHAILLSACLLIAGCSKDTNTNNTKSNVSSTTTTTTTKNTATTATPTPQATPEATRSPANTKLSDDTNSKPEDAAKGLFNAWGRNDREAAKKFASDAAIARLFKDGNNGGAGMSSQGCSDEPGGFNCAYTYDGGALIMHIKGSDSAGYKVASIEFIAD